MRKSRFTEAQIAMALRQGEAGTPFEEICRKLGISSQRRTQFEPAGTCLDWAVHGLCELGRWT